MTVEYNAYLKNLDDEDVLEFRHKLFKFGRLKEAFGYAFNAGEGIAKQLCEILKKYGIEIIPTEEIRKGNTYTPKAKYDAWFKEGVNFKVLKALSNTGWQSGKIKIKISVEFILDEPEIPEYKSPLDDIRNDPSFSNPEI